MREFLARHRPAIVAFIGLTLPLFLLYVHGRANRKTTLIEVALMKVTAPVQGAASRLLSGLSDVWNGYVSLVGVESENEALRDELGRLTSSAHRADALEIENARLRAMLDFKKARRDLVTVGAHVIGKDISPYARVVRIAIDAGEDAHLSEGMPVIDDTGLVGRLARVAGNYAEVLLTVDARSAINVRVQGKGVTGTLTGTSSQYNYVSRFTYKYRADPIEVGDLLVTSGHDKVFPPGIAVGLVRSIDERQRDVEYELQVTPAVNFADLDMVHVVVAVVEAPADGALPPSTPGASPTPEVPAAPVPGAPPSRPMPSPSGGGR